MKRLLTLVLLLLAGPALGASKYVSNSCLNNGDGLGLGCATTVGGTGAYNDLQVAFNNLVAGDTLFIRTGTGSYVTSYNPTGSGGTSEAYYHGGFHLDAHGGTAGSPITVKLYPGDTVPIIANCEITKTTYCPNPTITAFAHDYITFDGLTVVGSFNIYGAGNYALGQTPSTNITIANCNISEGWGGPGDGNWAGVFLQDEDNVYMHHNFIHDIEIPAAAAAGAGQQSSGSQIKVYRNRTSLFEYNTLKRTNITSPATTQAGGIDDKDGPVNNEYRYNWIEDVPTCFRLNNQGNSVGVKIHHNVCISTTTAGYSNGVRQLSGVNAASNFLFYNNTIFNTYDSGIDWASSTGSSAYNNIISPRVGAPAGQAIGTVLTSTTALNLLDYNNYAPTTREWQVPRFTRYNTLAAWRTASGKDAGALNVDCQFASAPSPYSSSST